MHLHGARLLTLLALVVSLSVHVTVASAAQATAELRAMACCDMGCEHDTPGTKPARCCGVERESQTVKTSTSATIPPVLWVSTLPGVASPEGSADRASTVDVLLPRSHGVPVFLLTRTLRI